MSLANNTTRGSDWEVELFFSFTIASLTLILPLFQGHANERYSHKSDFRKLPNAWLFFEKPRQGLERQPKGAGPTLGDVDAVSAVRSPSRLSHLE